MRRGKLVGEARTSVLPRRRSAGSRRAFRDPAGPSWVAVECRRLGSRASSFERTRGARRSSRYVEKLPNRFLEVHPMLCHQLSSVSEQAIGDLDWRLVNVNLCERRAEIPWAAPRQASPRSETWSRQCRQRTRGSICRAALDSTCPSTSICRDSRTPQHHSDPCQGWSAPGDSCQPLRLYICWKQREMSENNK